MIFKLSYLESFDYNMLLCYNMYEGLFESNKPCNFNSSNYTKYLRMPHPSVTYAPLILFLYIGGG